MLLFRKRSKSSIFLFITNIVRKACDISFINKIGKIREFLLRFSNPIHNKFLSFADKLTGTFLGKYSSGISFLLKKESVYVYSGK